MVTGDNIRILLISGRQMNSGAEMCSKPNRKYVRPGINKRKIQIQELGNEKNFQTHISDRFVSLVHHLHQLLRSVIKDILNVLNSFM